MKLLHAIRTLLACVLAVFFLAACGAKIEEQVAFKELVERQDRADKDVDAIRRQLSVIDRDLQQVSLDVTENLKKVAASPGSPQASAALDQRMARLETLLKSSGEMITAINGRLDKMEQGGRTQNVAAQPAPKPETAAESPGDQRVAAAPAEKTSLIVSKKSMSAVAAKVSPAAAPARATVPTRAAPAGAYHKVTQGQTLQAIAQSYKVSEASLRAANRLPPGRDLIAGQQVYVPAAVR